MHWTTLAEVRKKLVSRWNAGEFLAESLAPSGKFPMRLTIKSPSSKELSDHFSAVQDWIQFLVKSAKNTNIVLEWKEVNHRQLGRNQVPSAITLSSLVEVTHWLGKNNDLQSFTSLATTLLHDFPNLRPWVLKNPHQLLKEKDNVPRLMDILQWITANPRPAIYLRQLSLPSIDTKFFEQHKKLLADWFDLQLPLMHITSERRGTSQFEARYGFKQKPSQIRFRILDTNHYIQGLSDLTLTIDEFCKLELAIKTVFITENDINGLVFPDVPASIVLFGRGYGFDFLSQADWLRNKQIIYWGDIDTHGFAILNQCRHYLPQAKSLLMDQQTLLNHKPHWTQELKPTYAELSHLTSEETNLYYALQHNQFGNYVRLEQEFVNFNDLKKALSFPISL